MSTSEDVNLSDPEDVNLSDPEDVNLRVSDPDDVNRSSDPEDVDLSDLEDPNANDLNPRNCACRVPFTIFFITPPEVLVKIAYTTPYIYLLSNFHSHHCCIPLSISHIIY